VSEYVAVLSAGFEGAEAARIYRQVREELPNVRDDEIFEAILSLIAGGLARQAPGPCGCGAHVPDVSTGLTAGSAGTVLPLDGAGQRGHAVSRATLLTCWKE
jgi:hypothetical protein